MRWRSRTEPARIARRAALAALIGCALAAAPAGAASPSTTPSPTAKELWQTYPLDASPEPTISPRPARTAAHTAPAQADDSGGTSVLERVLQVAALLVALLALALWLRRDRPQPPAEASETPEPPEPPETPEPPEAPSAPPAPPPVRKPRALEPPDPAAAGTAEIVWTKQGALATFRAIVRQDSQAEAVLAESEPVRWPPTGAEAVAAVSAAAEALSARLISAGWISLGVGETWYSRRFAWQPHPEPAVAPVPRTRRFRPREDWPVEQYALWRCEVEPETDAADARCQAVVYPPGRRKGRVIASGQAASPLGSALRAAGWAPVTDGPRTTSARFIWRDDPPPATRLDLATTHETSEAQ